MPSSFGANLWRTGPNPTYKIGDQWVLSDRLLLDVQWAHIANNFILDFHEDALKDVQRTLIVSTGLNGRSGTQSVNIRPANSINFNANYFMPGTMGGDHTFKFGGYYRDNFSESPSTTGGRAIARFPTALTNDCAGLAAANPNTITAWCQAQLTRDGLSVYDLKNVSAYVQDTFTHKRLTTQLGIRYDRNHDQVLAASVVANPIVPEWLPAASFAGTDPKVIFNNFSPRVGFSYDVVGNGKTLAHANFARYYGQVGTGGVASQVNPVNAAFVRFPLDLGKDEDFEKPTPLYKIQTPPFYAAWGTPLCHDAVSGIRINGKCQVIDVRGQVIPNLYCGGESAGGSNQHGLGRTQCQGYIAGGNAAADVSW